MKGFAFRFFLLYFILIIEFSPFSWLSTLPGFFQISEFYFGIEEFVVRLLNDYLFHVRDELNIDGAGSGDTSYAWARFFALTLIAFFAALIWNLTDKKERNYRALAYGLRTMLRYYLALVAFSYGIIKIFGLQMPFPSLSQLATPLGDFLPMRLSWMFLGYGNSYQIFSGLMEVAVCLLLLNRKTVMAGLLLGFAVFSNVLILNLSYDIPVKLFAFQLVVMCFYLLAEDAKRLSAIFFLNSAVASNNLYQPEFQFRYFPVLRMLMKLSFIILFIILPSRDAWLSYDDRIQESQTQSAFIGFYKNESLLLNCDSLNNDTSNSKLWMDLILDKGATGSIHTNDSTFNIKYGRGYFSYQIDSIKNKIVFTKSRFDTTRIFTLNFEFSDSSRLHLWGKTQNDSLDLRFRKMNRPFQLTEKQFHWISESNR